ncbi:MAG: hypothetical protein ACI84K_001506 [Pseudohongiellaceae bacterium]|jgi:hypothetical protein
MLKIPTGIYQHYKGPKYEVLGQAQHSETEEVLVIYRALYGDYGLWVRPLSMFQERVIVNDENISRFQLIEAQEIQLGEFHE